MLRLRVSRVTHTCGADHSTSTQWYQLVFSGQGFFTHAKTQN
jgi:hypothetical protein